MKAKVCGVCLKEVPALWKAKRKLADGTIIPGECKSCANKPKPSIVAPLIELIQEIDLAILKQNKARKSTKTSLHEQSVTELLKLAVIVFNRAIRKRDTIAGTYFRCISCDDLKMIEQADCGHYMPSTYSQLKFNELNCNAECQHCNRGDKDHLVGYRKNLMNKIGKKQLEWLESHPIAADYKWDKQELIEIINKYK